MKRYTRQFRSQRRAVVAIYVALSMVFVLAFAALAVDMGMLYSAKAELQRAADSAAIAGAVRLLDEDRLKGDAYEEYVNADSRLVSVSLGSKNTVLTEMPVIDPDDDVALGKWIRLPGGDDVVEYGDSQSPYNAVQVSVRRDAAHGGSIAAIFASALGLNGKDLGANAVAGFADSISGYEVTQNSGNAQLLPFTLHVDAWEGLLEGSFTVGDNYGYDEETGAVTSGADGILELNLYPGAGFEQLPPGNFGTVDIGSPNNSTADIARQILEGINESDLSFFGGRIELGSDGTLLLNGDTGLSAGVKDELEAIKGQPRSIPIFSEVAGPGNNAMFTIVGWVGIRIMNVKLTGKMTAKELVIQPAYSIDDAAVSGTTGTSQYVYRPVQLIR